MRRVAAVVSGVLLAFASPALAAMKPETRTFFEFSKDAWAVGTVRLSSSMTYRNGDLVVYPSQITDLMWAPNGTKPRNLMLIHEVGPEEKDKPLFTKGDEVFVAIRLLPDHAYWKDNLPITRRHQIIGDPRYAFRGDDAVEARRVMAPFFAAVETKGLARWSGEVAAAAGALGSSLPILREDAARFLAGYRTLARDFDQRAVAPVQAYVDGSAPAAEKAPLVTALGLARIDAMRPVLTKLAARDDALGAAALRGLEGFGEVPATTHLLDLSRTGSPDLQVYAANALGRRSATDDAAFERAKAVLADSGPRPAAASAAATGLGEAGGPRVVAPLAAAVDKGNGASRAAAEALATIGSAEAVSALKKTLKEKKGEAALAAAAGLGRLDAAKCPDCTAFLTEQKDSHGDAEVRKAVTLLLVEPPAAGR